MSRFDDAVRLAADVHAGQIRKGDGTPYVLHPFEVACIAATLTHDEDVLIAALLHDTVEDAGVTIESLAETFGERVAALVVAETEDKRPGTPKTETWRLRKEESLADLANCDDPGVGMVWLADKLANMRSFARIKEQRGEAMWDAFNQRDPAQHEWYYRSVAELTPGLADTAAGREYAALLDQVFGGDA